MYKKNINSFFKRSISVFLTFCMFIIFFPWGMGLNTLIWGEEQQNQIVVNPEQTDIEDTLLSYRKSIVQNEKDKFTIKFDVTTGEKISTIPSDGGSVMIVMDNSGSMKNSFSKAKEAVNAFADKFLDSESSKNKLGLVTYEGGDSFHYDAYDEIGKGNVAKAESLTNNLTSFKEKVDKIPEPSTGSTNIQAGINLARKILDKDTSDNIKLIVILSDGASNYSARPVEVEKIENSIIYNEIYDLNFKFTSFDYNSLVGLGNFFNKDGYSTNYNITTPMVATISEAIMAKENDIEIFSLFFNNQLDKNEYSQGVFTMKNCASSEENYFEIQNSIELVDSLKKIERHVSEIISPWRIIDPMGDFIIFDGFQGVNPPGVSFDDSTKTLIWNMKSSEVVPEEKHGFYHYTLSYDITLNSSDSDFKVKEIYSTNGVTKLLYQNSKNGILEEKEVEFDVPQVKGYETELVDKKYYTLKFETNGGTPVDSIISLDNTKISINQVTTREGYFFKGWYEDVNFEKLATEITMDADKTVFAKWEKDINEGPSDLVTDNHFAYIVGYPEGNIYPESNITRSEVVTIFFRLLKEDVRNEVWKTTNNFTDVDETSWYNNAISTMENKNIINGYKDGTFRPDNFITRAELAAIAAKFDSLVYTDKDKFPDIEGHWAADYINRATEKGWLDGYPDGTFKPDQYITRAEAITLINRVLERDLVKSTDMIEEMIKWPDNSADNWYYTAIQEATNSHDYKRMSDNYEKWTKLVPSRDWGSLETKNN